MPVSRFDTEARAEKALAELNRAEPGAHFIAKTDFACDPWAIFAYPKIGEAVSMAFNGDCYPAGHIAKISPTRSKITTTTGKVFRRSSKRPTAWVDGCFSMVPGHRDERNPHF